MRTVFELLDEIDEFDDLPLTHFPLKGQLECNGQERPPSLFRTRSRLQQTLRRLHDRRARAFARVRAEHIGFARQFHRPRNSNNPFRAATE
jgi:hypothetical protein